MIVTLNAGSSSLRCAVSNAARPALNPGCASAVGAYPALKHPAENLNRWDSLEA